MKSSLSLKALLCSADSSLLGTVCANATNLYWSGDGTTQGGSGTWDASLTRWGSVSTGPYTTAWDNTAPYDTAIFGGTSAGTVTLGTNITTEGLQFNTNSYIIDASASTLNFTGTTNIVLNNIAGATINNAVGGTGSVVLSTTNPATAGTLTLGLTSTGGWSGSTTINAGMTLSLNGANQGLLNTSGITLNGGSILSTNSTAGQASLNRISNSAIITSNGGNFTYTNTAASGRVYAETIGSVDLARGQLNFSLATNQSGGGGNSQTLTLSGLSRTGAGNTSAVSFGSANGLNTTTNIIVVSGATATTAGQIIGPWAFYGTTPASPTDYAIYDSSSRVQLAGTTLTAPGESGWSSSTTAYRATSTAEVLTATRTAAALRYTPGAGSISLGASNFNLETYGILNGGSGTLTVSTTGTGGLTTPSGGGNLYLTPGNAAITVSAPIKDNGGTVTLVKSGGNTLTLSSTTSNFSGGIVLNAGGLTTTSDANLGTGGVTVNGSASWNTSTGTARSITINEGGVLTLTGASNQIYSGLLSGIGTLASNTNNVYNFTNPGNSLTGAVTISYGMNFANIGDSSNAINIGSTNANAGFGWTGASKTLAQRVFALNATGNGYITSGGTGALVIQQNLAISGTAGARTLNLQGSNTGLNIFAGNIANGTDGGTSVVTVAKAGTGNWTISGNMSHTGGLTISGGTLTLSGTNTYSGNTNFAADGVTLVIAGTQAASPNTTFVMNTNASSSSSTLKILDDTGGVNGSTVTLSNTVTIQNSNAPGNAHTYIVGNNNTVNGGTSGGATSGSTIAIANLNWNTYAAGTTAYGPIQIRGTDGYRLRFDSVTLHNAANLTSPTVGNTFFVPTTANVTLGTVTVGTGNTGQGYQTLVLDGTSSDNRVTGAISNASDVGISNRPLSVTKSNTSTWTLSGSNTYTGGTAINAGKLQFNGANSLPTTGTVAVGANGVLSLADGTARNQTVSALTLTSLGSLSFDWTGSGTGDQLTSTADITLAANTRVVVDLNRSGTPGGSVTLLTGGAGSNLNLGTARYYLSNTTDFTATLSTPTNNTLVVGGYTSQTPLTTFYWAGNKLAAGTVAGIDNAWALSDGTKTNWSSTTTAYTATALTPGATADVVFSNSQVGKTQQSTVLGADLTVKSLTIDDSVAVTIAGANGAAITLMGTSTTAGTVSTPGSAISVTSNANATSTISSRVNLGADQTWHVASGKTLAVSGIVGGDYSLTKASAGTLTLSALPEYTGTTTISAGALTFGYGVAGGASIIGRTSGITLSQGATLNFNTSVTGINNIYTAAAPITLSGGAGTANIRVAGNDVRLYLSGNVTGQSGVAQTLAITQGSAVTGGDRQNIRFSGVIANGGSGGTLGVSVDFAGGSAAAQNAFVNLSGQNTFTGDLTVTNSKGLTGPAGYTNQGAWLTIGGERYSPNAPILANMGNGYLGGGNYSGNISVSNGTGRTTLSYFSTANQILGGTISGTGALQMDGSGTLTLSGSNTYTGSTTINSGTMAVTNIDVVANNNALGKSSAAAANLILRGGTLQYTTGGAASTDRNFALVSSSTIDASGAGALTFTQTGDISPDVTGLTGTTTAGSAVVTALGSTANLVVGMAVNMTGVPAGRTIASIDSATQITLSSGTSVTAGTGSSAAFGYGSRTLTLTGSNTGANTIAGNLVNSTAGSGVLSVTKSGTGKWVLSGTNTYTGTTAINAGTLEIALGGSTHASSAVTVSNSGSTLIVNGTVNGTLVANASTTISGTGTMGAATINGILAPGNSIGTINALGDVTWNDNDAWVFELGSAASTLALANTTPGLSDLLNITGAGNDFLKGTGSSFTFDFGGGGATGWYKLVDWTSATTFAASDFVASNLGMGLTGSFTVDSGTSALYLNVVPEPRSALLGAMGALMLLRRRRKVA
jgi:fibronectin-binding autotransporter adhesin